MGTGVHNVRRAFSLTPANIQINSKIDHSRRAFLCASRTCWHRFYDTYLFLPGMDHRARRRMLPQWWVASLRVCPWSVSPDAVGRPVGPIFAGRRPVFPGRLSVFPGRRVALWVWLAVVSRGLPAEGNGAAGRPVYGEAPCVAACGIDAGDFVDGCGGGVSPRCLRARRKAVFVLRRQTPWGAC